MRGATTGRRRGDDGGDPSGLRRPVEQGLGLRTVAPAPGREGDADRQPRRVHGGVDLRRQPAAGAADRASPPRERAIAPARRGSGRSREPGPLRPAGISVGPADHGPCRSRALQITGPADHGPCRWWRPRGRTRSRGRRASPRGAAPTPPHGSGAGSGGARCASGRARVAGRAAGPPCASARAPHPSTASPGSRSSTAVRPLSPASPANSGAIRPHRASVNVRPLIAAPSDDREAEPQRKTEPPKEDDA